MRSTRFPKKPEVLIALSSHEATGGIWLPKFLISEKFLQEGKHSHGNVYSGFTQFASL